MKLIAQQQEQITQQQEQIAKLQALVEVLQAEIRRLKNLPSKPDIKPNTKPKDDDEKTLIQTMTITLKGVLESVRSRSLMREPGRTVNSLRSQPRQRKGGQNTSGL